MTSTPIHHDLKERHRRVRNDLHENLDIRLHRSLSWLDRAEKLYDQELLDEAFILYWISFNAIYSKELYRSGSSEKDVFSNFFVTLIKLDTSKEIFNAIWNEFSGPIKEIINNKYVFNHYWVSMNHDDNLWEAKFEKSQKNFRFAFNRQDTVMILCILFDRLYVLRNQIIHGSSTRSSNKNRSQVRDGTKIIAFLVPRFIELLMDNPQQEWAPPVYPVTS